MTVLSRVLLPMPFLPSRAKISPGPDLERDIAQDHGLAVAAAEIGNSSERSALMAQLLGDAAAAGIDRCARARTRPPRRPSRRAAMLP